MASQMNHLASPITHSPFVHTTFRSPFDFQLHFKPHQKNKSIHFKSPGNPSNSTFHCASTSSKPTTKKNRKRLTPEEDKQSDCGISSNMWWTDLKSAFGQRFNLEGIISSVKVVVEQPRLALPHATVPDIRWIDWSELRKRGFRGVVFDKDNTITVPYALALWPPLSHSIERCKAVFGDENVAVFSNSAGLSEFDPDGSKARVLEHQIGIKVIRHRVKKPAGNAEDIENHFGCSSSTLVMVGDRHFTDTVFGNRNGFLTILTKPLSLTDEPFTVTQVRRIEEYLVNTWHNKGLTPLPHSSGLQNPQQLVVFKAPTLHCDCQVLMEKCENQVTHISIRSSM